MEFKINYTSKYEKHNILDEFDNKYIFVDSIKELEEIENKSGFELIINFNNNSIEIYNNLRE